MWKGMELAPINSIFNVEKNWNALFGGQFGHEILVQNCLLFLAMPDFVWHNWGLKEEVNVSKSS